MRSRNAEAAELAEGAALLGVELDDLQIETLLDYLDRIYAWNDSAGLTRIERAHAVRLHLLDALTVVPAVGEATELVDLGTGAGVPGIPLAVAIPGLRVSLVETRRRKCSFLAEAVRELGLEQCQVLEQDARLLPSAGRTYEVVTARAFVAPRALAEMAAAIVRPGGRVVVMGGPGLDTIELAKVEGMTTVYEQDFTLPRGAEKRIVVALQKSG